jgi:hypothetical protein
MSWEVEMGGLERGPRDANVARFDVPAQVQHNSSVRTALRLCRLSA